jgi:hypothetical protein
MFFWKKRGAVFSLQDWCNTRPWLKEIAKDLAILVFDDFVRVCFPHRQPRDANAPGAKSTNKIGISC